MAGVFATPSAALVRLLQRDASSYTWVAATVGANDAAGVQLATGFNLVALPVYEPSPDASCEPGCMPVETHDFEIVPLTTAPGGAAKTTGNRRRGPRR